MLNLDHAGIEEGQMNNDQYNYFLIELNSRVIYSTILVKG